MEKVPLNKYYQIFERVQSGPTNLQLIIHLHHSISYTFKIKFDLYFNFMSDISEKSLKIYLTKF